jgi:hypothetical protein
MRRAGVIVVAALVLGSCGGDGERVAIRDGEKGRPLVFKVAPYMGVACRTPNSIRCDKIGLAVWIATRAERLTAAIEGRAVKMKRTAPAAGRGQRWEGFLRPAGIIDGRLEVQPDQGRYRWYGNNPAPVGSVRLIAFYGDGSRATRSVRVTLSPGWG